jgi:hypothetical protein
MSDNPDFKRLLYVDEIVTRKKVTFPDGSSTTSSPTGSGVSDHGNLSGLSDDDHTQYYNQTRHDNRDHSTALSNTFSPASDEFIKWNGSNWVTAVPPTSSDSDYQHWTKERTEYGTSADTKLVARVHPRPNKDIEVSAAVFDLIGSTSLNSNATLEFRERGNASNSITLDGNEELTERQSRLTVPSGELLDVILDNSTGSVYEAIWWFEYRFV